MVMDPCCGIGTFFRYIENNLSPRPEMIGAELMSVPCELASRLLGECRILRADSLQDIELHTGGKTLVILGNPPYSGHSANVGQITEMVADYRAGLQERNPKWLQDDYVKFMRMAQHRVDEAGSGVVAFITNHSYIFNPTFRSMRASLMRSFDAIHVLDLQGNAKRAEKAPDENVFPIQMGVGISFLIKTSDVEKCAVMYAETRGTRQSKMDALARMDFSSTPWREVDAVKPFYLFTPTDRKLQEEFYGFSSLFHLFGESSVGFVTSRDRFAIDFDREALLNRIADLRRDDIPLEEIRSAYPIGDLDLEKARRELQADEDWQDCAVEALYRPFDRRWAYLRGR